MDSFAWASVPQTAGLADGRGGGLMPPMLGFQLPPPAGLEHHFVDHGLVQRAARSSACFGAANGAPTASPSYTAGNGNPEPGFGVGGGVFDDAPSAEAAAATACSSRAPEPDSKKRSRRSNEDVLGTGTDQDQGTEMASNASADSASNGLCEDAKGEGEAPATRKKKGKGPSTADDESYIHVRARKGQATNRHSLAERLRREKISERMKLLQDLVPGCSKVTGKAVMLDEIINYVQSLQRQVEFLSMKLAAVNPQLGLNIKGLLSKDHIRIPSAPSSTHIGFSFSDEMMPKLPPLSQSGMLLGGVHGVANSNGFRTVIEQRLNGKELLGGHSSQMTLSLDGSFHSGAHAAYGTMVGPEHLSMRPDQDGFHI